MWEISKEFNFEFGHRVWKQELDPKLSLDTVCACRFLHGHSNRTIVNLYGEGLNPQGMITDFKHLNWFKKFLDTYLDHKFLFDVEDPLLEFVLQEFWNKDYVVHDEGFYTLSVNKDFPLCRKELLEGVVLLPFIPTSEKISRWFYDIVYEKMQTIGVGVSKVQFFETSKSQSCYSRGV